MPSRYDARQALSHPTMSLRLGQATWRKDGRGPKAANAAAPCNPCTHAGRQTRRCDSEAKSFHEAGGRTSSCKAFVLHKCADNAPHLAVSPPRVVPELFGNWRGSGLSSPSSSSSSSSSSPLGIATYPEHTGLQTGNNEAPTRQSAAACLHWLPRCCLVFPVCPACPGCSPAEVPGCPHPPESSRLGTAASAGRFIADVASRHEAQLDYVRNLTEAHCMCQAPLGRADCFVHLADVFDLGASKNEESPTPYEVSRKALEDLSLLRFLLTFR